MKQQGKPQMGTVLKFYSKDKMTVQVGSIYIGWVNQLTLSRDQINEPNVTAQQYLKEQYPIDDPYSSQCHRQNHCKSIFQVFKSAGCQVTFLSKQELQKQQNETDHEKIEELMNIEKNNKQKFIEQYKISEQIKDCYTIYYQDVGAQINQIMVFRDKNFWYRLDTNKRWPGYEY